MRTPVDPQAGAKLRWPSTSVLTTVELFELMPGAPGNGGQVPIAQLKANNIVVTDDASQVIRRNVTMDVARIPNAMRPGMWIRVTIGIPALKPLIYRLPSVVITEIRQDDALGAYKVACSDPGEVLNGQPYLADTVLTGTLRSLVQSACATLSRTPDVTGVPATTVPVGAVAEFGTGKWDVCLRVADDLGIDLRFTDPGDVVGWVRSSAAPAPVTTVEKVALGGSFSYARTPNQARVLVTRGAATVGLVGTAKVEDITGVAPPAWYPTYYVTDRQEGDTTTTQAQADALAKALLRTRVADLDTYDSLPIMPAPWLEAGTDVVSFAGVSYWVRAMTLDVPSLTTVVTLRRVV